MQLRYHPPCLSYDAVKHASAINSKVAIPSNNGPNHAVPHILIFCPKVLSTNTPGACAVQEKRRKWTAQQQVRYTVPKSEGFCLIQRITNVEESQVFHTEQDGLCKIVAACTVSVPGKSAGSHLYNELLAQERACDAGLPDVLEVLKAALKVLAVCQNTQACCPTLLVCFGNLQQHKLR